MIAYIVEWKDAKGKWRTGSVPWESEEGVYEPTPAIFTTKKTAIKRLKFCAKISGDEWRVRKVKIV